MSDSVRDHWPHFADLVEQVHALDDKTVTVTQQVESADLAAEGRRIQLALDAYQQRIGRR